MSMQKIINAVFLLLILALFYHGVQLNSWVTENRDRVEILEQKEVTSEENMTAEIEKCMDLYLSTEGSFIENEFGDEPVYARKQRKDAFQFCSLNWRKGGV